MEHSLGVATVEVGVNGAEAAISTVHMLTDALEDLDDAQHVKAGPKTSEFRVARSATWLAVVSFVLAAVVGVGPIWMGVVPEGSSASLIIGGAIATAGLLLKMLVDLRYIDSRTRVKDAAEQTKRLLLTRDPEILGNTPPQPGAKPQAEGATGLHQCRTS